MTRTSAFRQTALLLVLSLVLMGSGLRAPACGGACCSTDRAASHASSTAMKRVATSHSCCCGNVPVPCDLEKSPAPDLPDSALSASPRVDAPVLLAARPASATLERKSDWGAQRLHLQPFAQGPPGPVFLLTQSFLC